MQLEKRAKTHHSAMAGVEGLALGPKALIAYLEEKREVPEERKKSNIYIHVPFCSKICTFCSMRRSLSQPVEDYHRLVVAELEQYGKLDYIQSSTFDAVYFGGGTPTTLRKEALEEILAAVRENFNFTPDAEITIETTVSELTEDKIEMFGRQGVNRFSVGVQTFSDRGRELFGRKGTGEEAYRKLKFLRGNGFDNVSMDLIYSYAEQTKEELLEDLNRIYELDLSGFSLYSLISTKASKLGEAQSLKIDKELFDLIVESSQMQDYHFIEITKMVRRDQYRYVMNRLLAEDTLPIGAAAGGSLGDLMLMNPVDLEQYRAGVENFKEKRGMLFQPKYRELTKIKGDLQKGILPMEYARIKSRPALEAYVEKLLREGLAFEKEGGIYFTKDGYFWGNNISREFIALLQ